MNPVRFFASKDEFRTAIGFCVEKKQKIGDLTYGTRSIRYKDSEPYDHAIYVTCERKGSAVPVYSFEHNIMDSRYPKPHPVYPEPYHDITLRVNEIFETIRQHIEFAAKNYENSVVIPVLKGKTVLHFTNSKYCTKEFPYTALLVPLLNQQVDQVSFDNKGVLPCVLDKLVFPVIQELLSPCGFKTALGGETCTQKELRNPYFIASGITVSWTKELNPFVIFPQPPRAIETPKVINQILWDAYKLEQHTDLVFVCRDKREIRAHSLVLKLVCPHFDVALRHDFREKLEGKIQLLVESSTLIAVLDHIYSGKNPFDSEEGKKLNARELIDLATQWDLSTLREYAASFIGQNLKEEEWKDLKGLALAYQSLYLLDLYNYYALRFEHCRDPEIESLQNQLRRL